MIDHDDSICGRCHIHTVNRFASGFNRQIYFKIFGPDTEAVDAFACDWKGEVYWWASPANLIPRVIQHAHRTKAKSTLIVPEWPSSPFWPILFPGKEETMEFVVRPVDHNSYYVPGGYT